MHQRGALDVVERAQQSPEVTALASASLALGQSRVFQLLVEMPNDLALLPPSQHPSIPEHLSVLVWDCPETPHGPARVVQVRVGCRTGILPRGFVVSAFCDNESLGRALRDGWGFPVRPASIDLQFRYSRADLSVVLDGQPVVKGSLLNPVKVSGGSLAVAGSLNLVRLRGGLRLIQADFFHSVDAPEIGRPELQVFDAAALGDALMKAGHPIAATTARGTIELRPVRYLISATELAEDDTVDLQRLPVAQ
jgi:hypothetical protein